MSVTPWTVSVVAVWCAAVALGAPASNAVASSKSAPGTKELPPSCDSYIYCQGPLLETIQLSEALAGNDSKTFVDKSLKYSPNETLQQFELLMSKTKNNPSSEDILQFLADYFEDGTELINAEVTDWVENPTFLSKVADSNYKAWAQDLNALWKTLARHVSDSVKENSDKHSLIYVPNTFIVPGGRFRELYYWDTYWVVKGLLLCEMTETVKGILGNFLYLLDNYGIIPNGGRIYYLERSQPPMLTPMMYYYFEATQDVSFIEENIPLLEKEFMFWMKNRTTQVTVNGKTHTLARYFAESTGPRPESFKEDYKNAQVFSSDERKEEFYIDMKSAAESGWDFSCRWYIKDGTNNGNLSDIHTRYIIPADLNAFIFWDASLLSKLFLAIGNVEKARKYATIADQWKEAVTAVLWDEESGVWFDYDTLNNKRRNYFFPSNLAPLWTNCYDENNVATIADKVSAYIEQSSVEAYLGGIPTSLNNTGEQWDLPNAWPPLQSIIIQGLENTRWPRAQKLAYEFAEHWVTSNYKGYVDTSEMFEKYDAESPGKYGGGGEYTVQSGFGWTNGVILELLNTYGSRLGSNTTRRAKRSLYEFLSQAS